MLACIRGRKGEGRQGLDWVMLKRALFYISWLSSAFFGAYILIFYGGAVWVDAMEDWNDVLPHLYEKAASGANIAMGAHIFGGVLVLILGPLQFIRAIRARWPVFHRINGRVYITGALLTVLGGISYIIVRRTIGGAVMDIAFALYGALMGLAAVNTIRHARGGRVELHRAWAVRLFALGIGSWLYRMDYGIWLKLIGGVGHTRSFDGPFDYFMDFFFYVPNLIIAEIIIRGQRSGKSLTAMARYSLPYILALGAALVAAATFLFGNYYWLPQIAKRLQSL